MTSFGIKYNLGFYPEPFYYFIWSHEDWKGSLEIAFVNQSFQKFDNSTPKLSQQLNMKRVIWQP